MKTALIFAAGRGERLKPLTLYCPKAMCQVKGTPLIEYHLANLAKAGFERVIINHAWLGYQIRRYLGQGEKWNIEIIYLPEPPGGLETGGTLYSAIKLLGNDPFITVNADIYTDYPFSSLKLPEGSLAHLVLERNPYHNRKGDFGLANHQLLNHDKQYTFLGIACYHPEAFGNYQTGRYPVTPRLRQLAEQGKASGEVFDGLWMDIGTIERLRIANELS